LLESGINSFVVDDDYGGGDDDDDDDDETRNKYLGESLKS
jgi:hypothetical protein